MNATAHRCVNASGTNSIRQIGCCLGVIFFLATSGPVSAHHSVGMFDISTPIWVEGDVVSYNWTNPHSAIIVEQKNADRTTTRWALESSVPVNLLEDRGFTKDTFKPGDHIRACGYAPKLPYTSRRNVAGTDQVSTTPHWLNGADKVITGRLLLLDKNFVVEWSHYGPLESCMSQQELQQHYHQVP